MKAITSGHLCCCKVSSQAGWHFASSVFHGQMQCELFEIWFPRLLSRWNCLSDIWLARQTWNLRISSEQLVLPFKDNLPPAKSQWHHLRSFLNKFAPRIFLIHKIIIWFPCLTGPVNQIWVQLDYVPQLRDWILTSLWPLPIYTPRYSLSNLFPCQLSQLDLCNCGKIL